MSLAHDGTILLDRGRRVHRLPSGRAAAGRGLPGGRRRQPERVLRSAAQAGAPGPPARARGLRVPAGRPRRPRAHPGAVRRGAAEGGGPSRRPGGRALFAAEPARLRRRQPGGLSQRARGLPASRGRAPGLRLVQLRLRRQHQDAVLGARQCRPSGEPLRRDQEGERADGPHLQPSLPAADHGPALLHRLRPVGPARHGPVPVHQGHARRPADRGLQPRPDAARLHLHRRHRRRRAPGDRRPARRPIRTGPASCPTPAPAARPTGSTTSATTGRSS